jgi:predicted TPR repeat methyltransferase
VDLSPGMLEKARARHCFDTLAVAELTGYLRGHPAAWDLIVGCDTFNYFGELAPLLAAAQQALRPGGMLVFTLELAQGQPPVGGFRLDPSGRYSHATVYVHAALAVAEFELRDSYEITLRSEAHQPVLGLLVTATKPRVGPELRSPIHLHG